MSTPFKPFGAVAPLFKPSVPLFSGGCTVLSIQPSTSILSEKALAALKYAFLQNKKVGIAGVRVDSLKPPSNSDMEKAQAAYSIARKLVEWSEQFVIDDEPLQLQDDQASHHDKVCLETQDDHKMNDKGAGYAIDAKDDNDYGLRSKMFGEIKDPEIKDPEIKDPEIKEDPDVKDPDVKDPEIKLEMFELKEICTGFPRFETSLNFRPMKTEAAGFHDFAGNSVQVPASPTAFTPLNTSKAAETLDFLKDTAGCDGFDFFKSEDTDFGGINFLSYSSNEPMESLDDLTQHTVDIDLAFPVPPLPTMYSKMDSDPDLSSPIASPHSPFLFSPLSNSSPHTT
jgi:hypothetical protein